MNVLLASLLVLAGSVVASNQLFDFLSQTSSVLKPKNVISGLDGSLAAAPASNSTGASTFSVAELPKLLGQLNLTAVGEGEALDLALDLVTSVLLGTRLSNVNGTRPEFKSQALKDHANDRISGARTEKIILRSGYRLERYEVQAKDGYMTRLIRIVNPKADQERLKGPPVMLMHGGLINPTVYVWASAKQHHPEKYPRSWHADGPPTSSNRSLGMMLANAGYDVWLVGTRGADTQNQGHVRLKRPDFEPDRTDSNSAGFRNHADFLEYWRFSFDEIIENELPRQIDKVLEVTGAKNVSLMAFSLSTPLVLPFVATNKQYASRIHNMIIMAPIVSGRGANNVFQFIYRFGPGLPDDLGTILFTKVIMTQFVRDLLVALNKDLNARYILYKTLETVLTGPSPKWQTFLEDPVLSHILMPLSFIQFKHLCQINLAERYQKFDHGKAKNLKVYGSPLPPIYDVSQLNVNNWLLLSAGNDNLATPASVQQVLKLVNPKPWKHVFVPHFNHLDLVAAFENAKFVNQQILEFLEKHKF